MLSRGSFLEDRLIHSNSMSSIRFLISILECQENKELFIDFQNISVLSELDLVMNFYRAFKVWLIT